MGPTCQEVTLRFQAMPDEEVAVYASQGHHRATEHLMAKYRHMVESKARSYFLAGADHDDVVQEGMIGLYKAIRDFRNDRLARFRAFAELCVTRQIITAVKTATRQKHLPLNGYISLHYSMLESDGEGCLLDCIADERGVDPAAWLLDRRDARRLHESIREALSDLEAQVLEFYLQGRTYREMSSELSCRTKCIDNALQRIKRKVGLLLPQDEN